MPSPFSKGRRPEALLRGTELEADMNAAVAMEGATNEFDAMIGG